jgi:hypothetical protein
LTHYASPDFWANYRGLPAEVQSLADKSFALLKSDSRHPSLRLKRVGGSSVPTLFEQEQLFTGMDVDFVGHGLGK